MGSTAPHAKQVAITIALGVVGGCAPRPATDTAAIAARPTLALLRMEVDPTVRGARIVPERVDASTALGLEPGGGARSFAAGMRVLSFSNGSLLATEQRFAGAPKSFALPKRLGGGFLFVVSEHDANGPDHQILYRAESWLSPAQPIFASPIGITDLFVGLDRVYVRAPNGSHQALDPRSGATLDLSPWPKSPFVGGYRALDGWRAVAITDLRGIVATFDAGASWKPLPLPIEPTSVDTARIDAASGEPFLTPPLAMSGDFLVIKGTEAFRPTPACYALRDDESTEKLFACPSQPPLEIAPAQGVDATLIKSLGGRPLLAAIEDGWPVDETTALVARDGFLARISLIDGTISHVTRDAFPSSTSRCHPLPLLVDPNPPGLGFVCADASGRTILYAYDSARPGLAEVRRFEQARAVLSFGNGSIAVHGSCAGDGAPAGSAYCVLSREPASAGSPAGTPRWRQIVLPAEPTPMRPLEATDPSSVERASNRLFIFRDGRVASLFPPRGRLEDAHLEFVDGGKVAKVPLQFDAAPPDAMRAVQSGVWLDGFEEREPGIFGGWVEAAGAMLGVRVTENGQVKVGAYVRDAGSPIVSGRYGLGWGNSGRGYETTDGGMTWNTLEVPAPLSTPRERACGPIGCSAAGWIRVGWGSRKENPAHTVPTPFRSPLRPPRDLDLVCEALDSMSDLAPVEVAETLALTVPSFLPSSPFAVAQDSPPFYRTPPPSKHPDELMLSVQADDPIAHFSGVGPLRAADFPPWARIYAWGPRVGEWAHLAHWTMRWLSPYGSSRDVRSTSPVSAGFPTLDAAHHALEVSWSMGLGDEPSTALLLGRRPGQETTAFELEADHTPLEVRRADGEPFGQVDFATRAAGHWYLATRQAYGELAASVLWRVDGGMAHEFARVPRAAFDPRTQPAGVGLARRSDGRAIGLVVDGQPPPDRPFPLRWVLPIDLESGTASEPESLGAADLGDRVAVRLCAAEDAGWILDTAWRASARIALDTRTGVGTAKGGTLKNLYARERLSTERACIERLSGTYEPDGASSSVVPAAISSSPPLDSQNLGTSIVVSALRSRARHPLRCHERK